MDALPFHDQDGTSSDDVIKEKRNCKDLEKISSSYEPMDHECSWFENVYPKDKDEQLTITKFKAHSAFKKKDYHKALSLYEECRKLLPSNANLLLREVCESQTRCLMKIGRYSDAESILNMLVDEKGNPQDSTLQALLSDVYTATGNLEAAAGCLKKCIDLHPDYPSYFLKIANLYADLQMSEVEFQKHHDACFCEGTKSEHGGDEANKKMSAWYFVDFYLENIKQSLQRKKILVNEENVIFDGMRDCSITKKEADKDTAVNNLAEEKHLSKRSDSTADRTENIKDSGDKFSSLFENIFKNDDYDGIDSCSCMVQALNGMKDEMIQKDFRCCCIEYVLKFLKCMNSLDQGAFGQSQSLCQRTRVLDGEERNGITSDWSTNIESIHRKTWKLLMKITQIFVTVKAWLLLQKSVLYSKGFGRICEEKKLMDVEHKAVDLLGSKANVKALAQVIERLSDHFQSLQHRLEVLEDGQFLDKQASSTDRTNSN